MIALLKLWICHEKTIPLTNTVMGWHQTGMRARQLTNYTLSLSLNVRLFHCPLQLHTFGLLSSKSAVVNWSCFRTQILYWTSTATQHKTGFVYRTNVLKFERRNELKLNWDGPTIRTIMNVTYGWNGKWFSFTASLYILVFKCLAWWWFYSLGSQ